MDWGTTHARVDSGILHFLWKDQGAVSFILTVSSAQEVTQTTRRRPGKTSTSARTSRAPFGNTVTKLLWIPTIIDLYNHYMGGVDIADQLRSYYNTHRRHQKGWKAL